MENIYTTAKPFLVLTKLIGLFPKSFDGPTRKGVLRFKLVDGVFSFIALPSIVCLLVLNIMSEALNDLASEFVVNCYIICMHFDIFSFLILYFYQINKRENIVKLLHEINSADIKVKLHREGLTKNIFIAQFSL